MNPHRDGYSRPLRIQAWTRACGHETVTEDSDPKSHSKDAALRLASPDLNNVINSDVSLSGED